MIFQGFAINLRYTSWFSPGEGGTQQNFIPGGSTLRSNNLLFYIPFLTEKVPLSYTFYWQMVPLSHTYFRTLHPLTAVNAPSFKYK